MPSVEDIIKPRDNQRKDKMFDEGEDCICISAYLPNANGGCCEEVKKNK